MRRASGSALVNTTFALIPTFYGMISATECARIAENVKTAVIVNSLQSKTDSRLLS